MPDDAVNPGRAGASGSSGGATAAGETPAPKEAKSVASQFGAPASGADLDAGLSDRTQARIRDLSAKLKEAEEKLARVASAQTQPQQPNFFQQQPQTPSNPNYDAQITELERLARKAREAGDDDAVLTAMRGIAKLEGMRATNETLSGFFQEQQQIEAKNRFMAERSRALDEMFRAFPETSDPENEFRQLAASIWDSHPNLKLLPDGELIAAHMAWSERTRKKSKPQNLESSGSAVRVAPSQEQATKRAEALEAFKAGDRSKMAAYLQENIERVVRK